MRLKTLCRCCSAACAIEVEVVAGRVVDVKGDRSDPRTHGYLCPKGHSLPYFHHHPDRLDRPEIDGRETDWDTALDDLAVRLRRLVDAHGPDAVGLYQGTGSASDSLSMPANEAFVRALGSRQYYTAATVDVAPAFRAADLVCGSWFLFPVWVPEHEDSRFAIYLGSNPTVSHGYLTMLPDPQRRIRAFRRRGGQLWVVDPRQTQTAKLADRHLAIRPASDATLLAWLIRELLADGADRADYERMTAAPDRDRLRAALAPFTLERTHAATGLRHDELHDLLHAVRAHGRIAVVAGTGITLGAHALVTEWLRWVLLIVTGSLDRPGGMWFHPGYLHALEQQAQWSHSPPRGAVEPGPASRPDLCRQFGQNPSIAIVDEIEQRQLRGLLVVGGNPLTAFPNPARTERALRSLETLVSIDILRTPLGRFATHVLPATGQLERADLVMETRTIHAPRVVPPGGSRKPVWWILASLGRRLGVDLATGLDLETATDDDVIARMAAGSRMGATALFAAGIAGVEPPLAYGWVRERALPEGRWRLVPPGMTGRLAALLRDARVPDDQLLLLCGRQLTRTNSTGYVSPEVSRDRPRLLLHPEDAKRLQLEGDAAVELEGEFGRLTAQVSVDAHVKPGSTALTHGWYESNVCNLTSATATVDPLTCQPRMTAIPVRIARAPEPG
jgi:anaerobic selenocysteine-containing dehydrogenase